MNNVQREREKMKMIPYSHLRSDNPPNSVGIEPESWFSFKNLFNKFNFWVYEEKRIGKEKKRKKQLNICM